MTTRDQLKQLITRGDRFPAPTMPVSSAALPISGMKTFFTSGAADAIPEQLDNTRRFAVVEQPKPARKTTVACPIQLDGPYPARRHASRVKPVASVLLCALVAMALRGG